VREAWFGILGDLGDARVLELYAGSGALGIEALSRGAESLVAVEGWHTAARCLENNLELLGLSSLTTVITARVEKVTQRLVELGPYDLVLADPPWTDLSRAEQTLARTLSSSLLNEAGRVMIGHPKGKPIELSQESGLVCVDQRAWGDSGASLFEITRDRAVRPL
jgi:16S rRNA (guanine966-N2)-methyltransferase